MTDTLERNCKRVMHGSLIFFLIAPTAALSADCVYTYEMEVWQKDAFIDRNPMDHTATRTIITRACGTSREPYKVVDRCNHGSCPGDKGTKMLHRFKSNAQTATPFAPISCDDFTEYKVKKVPGENYGITGSKHVCNNDTFLEMGQILTAKRPDAQTASRICRNGQYPSRTGRDPKYAPSLKNVEAFVSKLGWNPATPDGGGGSSLPPPIGRPPIRLP